ncbi:hypothetical protein KAI58_01315 [Candidatus Gracilibacteria bacterium]|nr:hypothetical protein [Candidatus Gracilibacteria bacterium]
MAKIVPAVSSDYTFPSEVEFLNDTPAVTTQPVVDHYSEIPTTSAFDSSFTTESLQQMDLMSLVQMFVVYAFLIAAALSAVFIFVGGMSFILSGGSDEKIKQAINTIRYAIIGLIVTILSFTFVTIVGRMFGLNFLDYLSYGQIKDSINRLISTGEKPIRTFEIRQ